MTRCYSCFTENSDNYRFCRNCGRPRITEPLEPVYLTPGTFLCGGRYQIGEAIGQGGFGIVYKAWDAQLEIPIAIKEYYPSRLVTRAAGDPQVIVNRNPVTRQEYNYRKIRFLEEARTLREFGFNGKIVGALDFFQENNTAYFTMELLYGCTLKQYLERSGGKVDPEYAVFVANEIGDAVKALHDHKIIHRDVAPDNIFICNDKKYPVKLMDLGAALLENNVSQISDYQNIIKVDEKLDINSIVDLVVKVGYSPAEQYLDGHNMGPWSDIYSVGAILYEMLTGARPTESTNRKEKDGLPAVHELNPLISQNLSNTVMKAMAVNPHMRFQTMDQFLSALNGKKKVISPKKEKRLRRNRWIAGISAACILMTAGLGSFLHIYHDKKEDAALKPAEITVWYSVETGSSEAAAMDAVRQDFESVFPGVTLALKGIPAEEYVDALLDAKARDAMPVLFESSGVPDSILSQCMDLDPILETEQFTTGLFLDQYHEYYNNTKQLPLAIEVPVAYVITGGAASIDYSGDYFSGPKAFGEGVIISGDDRYGELLQANYGQLALSDLSAFMTAEENTSPVLLSSSMAMNQVRQTLVNYEKKCVFYKADRISCGYVYEWSICGEDPDQLAAAQRLLTWMLGNVYQTLLMITECSDGQIPVNPICFESKLESRYLEPIRDIYPSFVFERKG